MRRGAIARWLLAGLAAAASAGYAQRPLPSDPALEPLQHEDLIVWIVSHQAAPAQRRAALPTASREQTAGSFGQTSSSTGTPAGDAGQTAGSFGKASSNAGATASATGQTAGSFGVSTSDLAQASMDAHRMPAQGVPAAPVRHDPSWDRTIYRGPYPRIRYVDVGDGELADRLAATANTDDRPDVLLGNPLPPVWAMAGSELAERYGVTMLGDGVRLDQTEAGGAGRLHGIESAILLGARHPAAARAYAVSLRDGAVCLGCYVPTAKTAETIDPAERVLNNLLHGQAPGEDADPEMAKFSAPVSAEWALGLRRAGNGQKAMPDLTLDLAVSDVQLNRRLALVQLRGIVQGRAAFGVVHALAVLRLDATGRWRVLQMTPNLDADLIARMSRELTPYASRSRIERPAGASLELAAPSVLLAAPLDGDVRPPQPELWWDNLGGATLQVVEWQVCAKACGAPNLYFVPDSDARLHTRVVARFADQPGPYRWRVWSMASGGVLVLSPWRTLTILAR